MFVNDLSSMTKTWRRRAKNRYLIIKTTTKCTFRFRRRDQTGIKNWKTRNRVVNTSRHFVWETIATSLSTISETLIIIRTPGTVGLKRRRLVILCSVGMQSALRIGPVSAWRGSEAPTVWYEVRVSWSGRSYVRPLFKRSRSWLSGRGNGPLELVLLLRLNLGAFGRRF